MHRLCSQYGSNATEFRMGAVALHQIHRYDLPRL